VNGADRKAAVDRPDVVAEVTEAFEEYERALAAGNVPVLTRLFWDDPRTVRFGVADRQHGAEEIAAWRSSHPSVPPGRRLYGTTVLTVDDRTAVVSTLFGYPGGAGSQGAPEAVECRGTGSPCVPEAIEGRQTQMWARFPEGWRIVAAHVSEVPAPVGRNPAPTGDQPGKSAVSPGVEQH
jgi:hypothetical protein